jgi:hypothetical protein
MCLQFCGNNKTKLETIKNQQKNSAFPQKWFVLPTLDTKIIPENNIHAFQKTLQSDKNTELQQKRTNSYILHNCLRNLSGSYFEN